MATWLDRLAAELGVAPLTDDEVDDLLELAREVAHGVERRYAPLSTFLAGVAIGSADGRREELGRVKVVAERLVADHDPAAPSA